MMFDELVKEMKRGNFITKSKTGIPRFAYINKMVVDQDGVNCGLTINEELLESNEWRLWTFDLSADIGYAVDFNEDCLVCSVEEIKKFIKQIKSIEYPIGKVTKKNLDNWFKYLDKIDKIAGCRFK